MVSHGRKGKEVNIKEVKRLNWYLGSASLYHEVKKRFSISSVLCHICFIVNELNFRKITWGHLLLRVKFRHIWDEISSSHGGEYDVQSCLLGCTAV
jgi:hypothetical protein